MATITPSTERQADLKLADTDPEVTHSGTGDRFTVKFTMEGVNLLELENVLRPRLAAVGVERISRFGMTMSLYGVEAGREGEVFHELETAIEDVNVLRENARDDRERSRSAAEAADALAEGRLEKVRDGFHTARESGITSTTTGSEDGATRASKTVRPTATVSRNQAMTDEKQDQERANRDQDRSEEAHWQVAEAAAEKEEERLSETARQSGRQHKEWENEGGALGRDP